MSHPSRPDRTQVLGIKSASVGLNFTSAAVAVFAELSFTPGDLKQVCPHCAMLCRCMHQSTAEGLLPQRLHYLVCTETHMSTMNAGTCMGMPLLRIGAMDCVYRPRTGFTALDKRSRAKWSTSSPRRPWKNGESVVLRVVSKSCTWSPVAVPTSQRECS